MPLATRPWRPSLTIRMAAVMGFLVPFPTRLKSNRPLAVAEGEGRSSTSFSMTHQHDAPEKACRAEGRSVTFKS